MQRSATPSSWRSAITGMSSSTITASPEMPRSRPAPQRIGQLCHAVHQELWPSQIRWHRSIWLSNVNLAQLIGNTLTQAEGGVTEPMIRTDHTSNSTVENIIAPHMDEAGSTGLTFIDNTTAAEVPAGSTIEGASGSNDELYGGKGDDEFFGGGVDVEGAGLRSMAEPATTR